MKRKIVLRESDEYFNGLYFDAHCAKGGDFDHSEVVRFVFFEVDGKLCRAMLSNNEIFSGEDIVPRHLRFKSLFKYAGLLSPYGYRNRTITDMMGLMNKVFGSWRFAFFQQEVTIDMPRVSESQDTFVSNHYTPRLYTGQHSYHHSHSETMNTPTRATSYRIGVELEVEAKTEDHLESIRKYRSNWFFMERDGSLNDMGVEFVTIPLLPIDARSVKFWKPLCGALSTRAVSWDSSNCGLHVHIGRELLGSTEAKRSEALGKLLYLYHHFVKDTAFNTSIFGRSRAYRDMKCESKIAKVVDILGKKVLRHKELCNEIDKELKDRASDERYFDINILNSRTIEFRRGKGSLNSDRICSVIEYSELLCLYARKAKWEKISDVDFFEFAKKKVKRTSPLNRFISREEADC